jgi:hypothetical protein
MMTGAGMCPLALRRVIGSDGRHMRTNHPVQAQVSDVVDVVRGATAVISTSSRKQRAIGLSLVGQLVQCVPRLCCCCNAFIHRSTRRRVR